MQKVIKHRWFFEHAPETVWEFLTKSEWIALWLMENDFLPIVGHKFMFRTKPIPAMEFDGNIYCEVLEIVPLKKLVYSWKGGPEKGRINLDTVVTWTLIPKNGGSELQLEHSGLDSERNSMAYTIMSEGWDKNIRVKMGDLIKANIKI